MHTVKQSYYRSGRVSEWESCLFNTRSTLVDIVRTLVYLDVLLNMSTVLTFEKQKDNFIFYSRLAWPKIFHFLRNMCGQVILIFLISGIMSGVWKTASVVP